MKVKEEQPTRRSGRRDINGQRKPGNKLGTDHLA